MNDTQAMEEAVEVLQQLGLKEYEARCFVGLSRLRAGTAKQLADLTEVPRTRVYDAIRMLEAQGLVEIQHSSPQQFRSVPLQEATETLRDQYEARVDRLHDALTTIEVVEKEDDAPIQQVWAMSGYVAIENRAIDLMEEAREEVVLVIGDESLVTDELLACVNDIPAGVEVLLGAVSNDLERELRRNVSGATTFVSGLEWLVGEGVEHREVAIGRLLLVDRSAILVSSIMPDTGSEQAIFGEGFGNGLVVIARRLMAQGLVRGKDPAS